MSSPGSPDRTAGRLRQVLSPGQRAIGVAAHCRNCNAVGLLVIEVPEPITMGSSTCHVCEQPLLAVFGLGNRDQITGEGIKLAMVNAGFVLGRDSETSIGVSVGVRAPDFDDQAFVATTDLTKN